MNMKFIQKNMFKVILITFLFVVPVLSLAQLKGDAPIDPTTPTVKLENPIEIDSINGFIKILLEGLLRIGMPIVALAVIYCGFLFVAARGNAEKLTKAKDALLYTLIGAAILFGAWTIAQLISDTVLSL